MNHLTFARSLTGLAAVGALASTMALMGAAPAHGVDPNTDKPSTTQDAGVDTGSVIVRLSLDPLATSSKVNRSADRKVNLQGVQTRNERANLAQQRNALKTWLRRNVPKAKVTGEYDFAVNAVAVRLNGTDAALLRGAPGVAEVTFQQLFTPAADPDPDLALIDAPEGWTAAGATSVDGSPTTWAGYGTKVGIIDTGIDASHPCFDDAGFPATTQAGDPKLTNNKVIVAKVFNNKINQNGVDATAVQDHGTHVAGTVACNLLTPATIQGADIPYDPSGVAPGAQLGNYNVFPGDIESARSEDIVNAMNEAGLDGMDVLNLSLGGGARSARDIYSQVITNLDRAGIVVAIANGNDGPGYFTAGSPGTAVEALTAGASSVGHFVGLPILAGGSQVTVAAIGDFPVPDENLSAALGVVMNGTELSLACAPLEGSSLTGKIALVSRGTCTFGTKIFHAEQAGAVGVIVVNNAPGDPAAMGGDAAFTTTIPAVMVGLSAKPALMALDGELVTIGAEKAYLYTGNNNILMGFSSWGPVPVTFAIKPDVVAPGGNVISSLPLAMCAGEDDVAITGCWGLKSGTSMATPHLAGMAAVVKDAHGSWTAPQIRSAIINTADVDGVMQTAKITTPETNVLKVGNGLADLDAAVGATLALNSPSVSFGKVPAAAGRTVSKTVTVTNLTGTSITTPVKIGMSTGGFSVNKSSLTVPAHGSAMLTLTWTSPKKSASSLNQAHLLLGGHAHAALFAYLG